MALLQGVVPSAVLTDRQLEKGVCPGDEAAIQARQHRKPGHHRSGVGSGRGLGLGKEDAGRWCRAFSRYLSYIAPIACPIGDHVSILNNLRLVFVNKIKRLTLL